MNFWKRHVGDIAKACGHLSQGQMGAYDLLLDWLYGNEKPLPQSREALHRIGRAVTKAERANVDAVIGEFFSLTPEGYVQKRASEEIARAQAIGDTNRRIAEEREARKRAAKGARSVHEPCNGSSTNGQPSQTPDTRHHPETEDSVDTPPPAAGPADRIGQFEGHESPSTPPNPVAPFAVALNRLGFRCTSMTPDLVAYQRDGGTVEHLTECASLPDCTGKPAAYAIRIARRELTERPPTITGATHEPARQRGLGRRLSAVEQVEHAIRERREREAAEGRTFDA